MEVLSYSDARANLKDVMDDVTRNRNTVVVTRQKAESVVMMSLSDWNAVNETLHLLSTPHNASRLRDAVRQLDGGKGEERELIEP